MIPQMVGNQKFFQNYKKGQNQRGKNITKNFPQTFFKHKFTVKFVATKIIQHNCQYPYDFANNEEEGPQLLGAMTLNKVSDPNQYVDTGATSHVTNDLGNLFLALLQQK